MSLNKNNLTLYFFIFFTLIALAQENQPVKNDSVKKEVLEPVLITATRTIRQLSAVPLPVQIITKNEIKAINSLRLSDILEEQTGLLTVPDFGGGEGIQMQGLDSQYTLILIDGVPLVGRSAGTLDLNRISVGNIKQIEVIKGASSSLYGNEALGGVINIITETPKSGFKGDLNHRIGTFNSNDTALNLNYKSGKFGFTSFLNRNSSEGYDLNENTLTNTVDPFVNYTLSSNITYELNKNTNVLVSSRFYNQTQDEVVLSESLSGETEINEWNLNLRAEHKFNSKWKAYLELYGSEYNAQELFLSDISEDVVDNDFRQRFLRPELRTTYKIDNESEFIFGLGLTNERLFRTLFSTTPEFNSPYVYTQYDGQITDKLNLILGARFDAHSEYQSQFSPKAALQYQLSEILTLKSSVGYGFKAPDFRQLYLDFTNTTIGYTVIGYNEVERKLQDLLDLDLLNFTTMSNGQEFSFQERQQEINSIASRFNTSLQAESSVSINLGADIKFNEDLRFSVNAFRNNIDNLIEVLILQSNGLGTVTDRPQLIGRENGQNIFSYQNRAEVYTQGLELDTKWQINDNLKLSGGYQLLYAFDKEAQKDFEDGRVFARDLETQVSFRLDESDYFGLFNRSRHTANLKLFYDLPMYKLNANVRATYRSKFGLGDTNGNNYLDRFDTFVDSQTIVDLAINKTIYQNYKIGIGVDNLFDLIDQRTPNIPGRLFYANFSFNF